MTKKVIATNGILNIVDIIHEVDDFVVLDDGSQHVVCYEKEVPFFEYNGEEYCLNEFIRTDI